MGEGRSTGGEGRRGEPRWGRRGGGGEAAGAPHLIVAGVQGLPWVEGYTPILAATSGSGEEVGVVAAAQTLVGQVPVRGTCPDMCLSSIQS